MPLTSSHTTRRHSSGRPSLRAMIAVARQRRALAGLSENALSDLGLSHSDVEREASKPVWDVPVTWRSR